jgi:hypothetical protein
MANDHAIQRSRLRGPDAMPASIDASAGPTIIRGV